MVVEDRNFMLRKGIVLVIIGIIIASILIIRKRSSRAKAISVERSKIKIPMREKYRVPGAELTLIAPSVTEKKEILKEEVSIL